MNQAVYTQDGESIISAYFARVYMHMTGALVISGLVAWWAAHSIAFVELIATNSSVIWILIIAELGLVFWLAARAQKMSATTAIAAFMIYAALNGLTLSTIFLVYTAASITKAFLSTAGLFGIMSLYGYTTKRNLASMGGFLFMSLIGIIIASVVNFWFKSPAIEWVVTYAGVFIFIGLTAYDTQKLKRIGAQAAQAGVWEQLAILGALTLYLDFINLFLFLLRIFGRRD